MRRYILSLSIFLIFTRICPAQTLRSAADDHLLIGTAVMSSIIDDPARSSLLAEQFNCITGENEFKPASLEPMPGVFTFTKADRLVEFAQQHKMMMIGHTLCWQQQTPRWFYNDSDGSPLSREESLAHLKAHIDGVLIHYKGQMRGWDVVNEALGDRDDLALNNTPAKISIGDDYILKAFEYAHAADPSAELYYNDYLIERPSKRRRAIALIKKIQAAGLRLDAVGIQGHWVLEHLDIQMIEDAIVEFHALGIKVSITELDIDVLPGANGNADITHTRRTGANPYVNGCPPEVLQQEAKAYGDLFAMLNRHRDAIERVTFWGLDDSHSWLNDYPVRDRTNYPLLFDRQLQPKPAFFSVLNALNAPGSDVH